MAKKDIKSNLTSKAPPSPYLLLLFFFSGFVSLCYQVVWVRELSVIFGKTNAAIAVVVSVFMLGLGLGSLFWGKRKITSQKLSNTFAFLQFGIGGGSFILLLVFPFLSHIYQGTTLYSQRSKDGKRHRPAVFFFAWHLVLLLYRS